MRAVRAIFLSFLVLLFALPAVAEQFTLQERTLTQREPHAWFPLPDAAPANWKAPADYAGGTAYFRLEVTAKPTAVGVMYQACLEQDGRASGKRACGPEHLFYEQGVYDWSQPLPQFSDAGKLDWARKPQELHLMLKDCYGKAVDSAAKDWVGSPYLSLYYPMQAKFSAVIVSKGGTFSGWPTQVLPPQPSLRPVTSVSWRRRDGGMLIEFSRRADVGGPAEVRILDLRGRTLFQWTRAGR